MNIKIPVQNNVEVIVGDVYVSTRVNFHPMFPPQTTEGKLAVDAISLRLNQLGHEMASKISQAIEEEMEKQV
jgi:DNA-binding ferritin-like protein